MLFQGGQLRPLLSDRFSFSVQNCFLLDSGFLPATFFVLESLPLLLEFLAMSLKRCQALECFPVGLLATRFDFTRARLQLAEPLIDGVLLRLEFLRLPRQAIPYGGKLRLLPPDRLHELDLLLQGILRAGHPRLPLGLELVDLLPGDGQVVVLPLEILLPPVELGFSLLKACRPLGLLGTERIALSGGLLPEAGEGLGLLLELLLGRSSGLFCGGRAGLEFADSQFELLLLPIQFGLAAGMLRFLRGQFGLPSALVLHTFEITLTELFDFGDPLFPLLFQPLDLLRCTVQVGLLKLKLFALSAEAGLL
jgi:hypothetical protein